MTREERKAMFIARAMAHGGNEEIRKEAEEVFEKANPRKEQDGNKQ